MHACMHARMTSSRMAATGGQAHMHVSLHTYYMAPMDALVGLAGRQGPWGWPALAGTHRADTKHACRAVASRLQLLQHLPTLQCDM